MTASEIAPAEVDELYDRLNREAETVGYHLNPDTDFTRELVKGLITNQRRYGYWACPCRLASGVKADDLDIVCPCDYRDADLLEYGACYCALYVSGAALKGEKKIESIPERRPPPEERGQPEAKARIGGLTRVSLPVWRCRVCGYLCARDSPPEVCPICRGKQERFERFL
ncbi:MAG: ferredoxin:glutaredoxin reductase [Dehalococcoidia bacterium]|nr:MAG: ferredoxin:glutaredoxin reductase [Dehalococcoidia bacterium]